MMRASNLFEREFSHDNLRTIFNDRIIHTVATGKDGVGASAFAESLDVEIARIIAKARNQTYKFTTFKQKLISKGAGKPPREISIATVRDRIVLRALTNILMEIFNDRKLPAPHYFIAEISNYIRPLENDYSFVQIDIKDFYPSIMRDLLMVRVRSRIRSKPILHLLESAIDTPTGNATSPHETGIPQGLSISNILSAIYMTRFDEAAHEKYTFFRYVDDIVVVCKSDEAHGVLNNVSKWLKDLGLRCHALSDGSKTKIVPVGDGIDYLGYNLRPNDVSIRGSSYKRMIENVMAVITSSKSTTFHEKVLLRLNIKITGCIFNQKRMGWMFFFSMTKDISQLKRLDHFVSRAWAKAGMSKFGRPKNFVKSYYEINFNIDDTRYIPKFDDYTLDQKATLIAKFDGKAFGEVRSWPEDRINRRFLRLVKREVSELEKDVTPFRYR